VTRAILIANPNAARTEEETVRSIERVLRAAGWSLEVLATGGPGDARRLAEYGVAEGVDVVAVLGGDGTTMQAAAALVGTDAALGLIPGGTGNLLASNLRLPLNPVRAAEALVHGVRRAIDLGRIEREDGSHYFAVAAGAGADARVMTETSSAQKHRWGMMAYIATTIRILPEIRNIPFHVTVDGEEFEAEAAMLLVANCGEVIPPVVKLGNGITPDDGLLDVIALGANTVGEGMRAVWDLLTERGGTYGKDVFVAHARGREITVEVADGAEQLVQLDGDPGGETPFTASVVPGGLTVMLPPA
jgi:YegS/Rv2252/BmrU family lipid kinase